MRVDPCLLRRFTSVRRLRWFALAVLLAGATAMLPGRDAEKKPPEKGMRVEEEDDTYKGGKTVLRIDEPDVIDKSSRLFPRPAADLKLAARDTKSAFLRKIYDDLDVPHDFVQYSSGDRQERIQPFDHYIGDRPDRIKSGSEVTPFDADWKPGKAHSINRDGVEKIRHYEELVRDAVKAVLANDKELLKHERLAAAEQLLTVGLSFNETAKRDQELKERGKELRGDLFRVLIEQVKETGDAKDWNEAADLARRLTTSYTTEADDQMSIATVLADLLLKALTEEPVKTVRLREVRQQVRMIVDQYAGRDAIKGAAANLQNQARHYFTLAKKAVDDKQLSSAEELLQLGTELDPQSQELRDLRTKLNEFYPVLRVAMRDLPQFFSPARATTESELRAVELLFEGLVKMVPGPDGASRFRPGLAGTRPRVVPLGREFVLPPHASWSNNTEITPSDVQRTVEQLKEGLGGRPKGWGDLLNDVDIGESRRVPLTLKHGHLDPLALMTFKIIPRGIKAGDEEFAAKPIGSGPYRLGTKGKDATGDYVSFLSNPAYGSRPGRSGLPRIREIRFYVPTKDPVQELKESRLDLVLDLTAVQVAALAKETKILTPPPGPNRRVYFLAVNHEPGGVLASADFRRGLALAIDREELLKAHFRKGLDKSVHQALNGPFPAGSWACKPAAPGKESLDPFDLNLAKGKLTGRAQLTLKYPTGDKNLAEALNDLRRQVQAANKDVTLDLAPLSPHELRRAVETHNFQLAYYWYDFPDETYWLGPLLGLEGNNLLQYRGGELQGLIREAADHREFDKVRDTMRAMHTVLDTDMPLIPLWQLDPLSAYREDLKPTYYDRQMGPRKEVERVPYDPLLVFTDAENWRLERQ